MKVLSLFSGIGGLDIIVEPACIQLAVVQRRSSN